MLRPTRCTAALLATTAAFAFAACGDDEDDGATGYGAGSTSDQADTSTTEATPTETSATKVETVGDDGVETGEGGGVPSPSREDTPAGAGDEVPASSQALFTGRGGSLSPRVVRVPPFIAVRVELRSADGAGYSLSAAGRKLEVGGDVDLVSAVFDGLRPGKRLTLDGPQGRVVVEASAEPGP